MFLLFLLPGNDIVTVDVVLAEKRGMTLSYERFPLLLLKDLFFFINIGQCIWTDSSHRETGNNHLQQQQYNHYKQQ